MPPKRGRGRGRGQQEEQAPRGRGPQQEAPRGRGPQQEAPRGRGPREQQYVPPNQQVRPEQGSQPVRQEPPPRHELPPTGRVPQSARKQATPPDVAGATQGLSGIQFVHKPSQTSKFTMAPRPGQGKNGILIPLIANYFVLKYNDISIYHYDIEIEFIQTRRKEAAEADKPGTKKGISVIGEGRTAKEDAMKKVSHVEHQLKKAPGKQRCREIFSQMLLSKRLESYFPVYDGQKNMYTIRELPIGDKETYRVSLEEDKKFQDFDIIVKPVRKQNGTNVIDASRLRDMYLGRTSEVPQELIMVFDTVMNHRQPPLNQCQVGRSFFLLNQRPYSLGDGLEIWFGYNQSVHLTQRGPAVIVNFSAKAFHKSGSVIEYASEILNMDLTGCNRLERHQVKVLTEKLKKVRVQATHLPYPRKYIVKAVTNEAARDIRLNIDGKDKTVARYFEEKYRSLRFSHLPCLHMQSTNKTTFLPFEVCSIIPNQPVLGKLDGQSTAKMIRTTAIAPEERFRKITDQVRDINRYSGEAMKQFKLFMEMEFMKLNGRVIPAPALAYGGSGGPLPQVSPDPRGVWRMDGKKFLRSIGECSWALISFANPRFCHEDCLNRFADTLCKTARSVGLQLQVPKSIRIHGRNVRTYDALRAAKDQGVTFAVVVLSPRDGMHTYEEVKFMGDVKLRLITQCMDETVVAKKFNPQVATNVLLKVNSKVGGVNHAVQQKHKIFSRPVIIMGADAAHSPRGFPCPSIAAVVGSLDAHPSQYAVTCRTQRNRDENKLSQEVIIELRNMVRYILRCFLEKTRGKKPEKIIFFRDGVSEGQFKTVLENEVEEVQRACLEELDHVPPLTFIIVQKRHQTRFRPQDPRRGVGKMGNVPPGTTVDTDVVHPIYFDFFICSHEGIQGTSKPAHYTVLFDENNFTADELQQLCYHLCHMYARCNRSISIPAPVMYAHLACARAKKYADLHIRQDTQSTVSSGSSDEPTLPPDVEKAINDMGEFSGGMFYV